MKESTKRIMERYNLSDKIENLTKDLLEIRHAVGVEFDLNCFLDNIPQVIFLVKYDIPVRLDDYFKVRIKFKQDVIEVAKQHGLHKSEDTIEDYGEHFYFVFYHDKTWREQK
jgi:hypothetical protein